jgi:DNA polymerase-3 subunit gamma/tau
LIAFGGGTLNEANARAMLGTIDRDHVWRIVDALSREDGSGLLAQVRELDRDAPDYDRALVDLAALLQRIAIAQILPEAAQQDEEFDAPTLSRLGKSMSPEDVQLYYQIALAGRRDLPMAPEPRLGFEMTLLRMLAFRPDTLAAVAGTASAPVALGIDAGNWPAVLDAAGLSGMTRQFALNCVVGSFENDVLTLRLDQSVAERRTRPTEEKLVQGLSKYLGRDIRIVFDVAQGALATPARQRVAAEQDKAARAAADFEQDPAVKGLRERFGAEVDAASVKPVN